MSSHPAQVSGSKQSVTSPLPWQSGQFGLGSGTAILSAEGLFGLLFPLVAGAGMLEGASVAEAG